MKKSVLVLVLFLCVLSSTFISCEVKKKAAGGFETGEDGKQNGEESSAPYTLAAEILGQQLGKGSIRFYIDFENTLLYSEKSDYTLSITDAEGAKQNDRVKEGYFIMLPGEAVTIIVPQKGVWYWYSYIEEDQLYEKVEKNLKAKNLSREDAMKLAESLINDALDINNVLGNRKGASFGIGKNESAVVIHTEPLNSEDYIKGWRTYQTSVADENAYAGDELMPMFFGNVGIETEIIGGFNGWWELEPEDNYEVIRSVMPDDDILAKHGLDTINLYEYSKTDASQKLEINGQQFNVGILFHTSVFRWFRYADTEYLCLISHFGSSWAPGEAYLFDITNKNKITLVADYAPYSSDEPQIGLYPKNNPSLCVLNTILEDERHGRYIRLCKITRNGLEPVLDAKGAYIEVEWEYNKWEVDPFKILETHIP
ncbi:hypothetical protein AGMMS49579_04830 [Spirochaetia bacterium]|nr:hypothetical protein AGMMS49579_04830 [Spirochaetia bacterium]